MDKKSAFQSSLSLSELIAGTNELNMENNLDEVMEHLDIHDNYSMEDHLLGKPKPVAILQKNSNQPFAEQRKHMVSISDHIFKKTLSTGSGDVVQDNSKVTVQYHAYWDGETEPFDSSYTGGEKLVFVLGTPGYLDGFQQAIGTMQKFEESEFIISYELLYKEQGFPPRIKPKADALFSLKLLDYEPNVEEVDEDKDFTQTRKFVKKHIDAAKKLFKNGQLESAIRIYQNAVETLDNSRIRYKADEDEFHDMLFRIYRNLAVCYNQLNNPKKVCLMIKEIKRFRNINSDPKCLYQEGRALGALGEYKRARAILSRAYDLKPTELILKEMKALKEKENAYEEEVSKIWKCAFTSKQSVEEQEKIEEEDNRLTQDKFREYMRGLLDEFDQNDEKEIVLPSGLTLDEINVIEELVKSSDSLELQFFLEDNSLKLLKVD